MKKTFDKEVKELIIEVAVAFLSLITQKRQSLNLKYS